MKKAERLLSMLMELPPRLEEIEKELKENEYTTEEVTLAACEFAENCFCECRDFVQTRGREPKIEEVHSSYIYAVCELLLGYGLNPNLVLDTKHGKTNIIFELRYVDNKYSAAETVRLLLENGGSTQVTVDGESVFDMLDYDVIFDVIELGDRDLFDKEVRLWLLMIGYGARLTNGKYPIEIKDGYDFSNFKQFEKYSYTSELLEKDWVMHIFDENGQEVAKL